MITGILAGITWAMATVILGTVMEMTPLLSTEAGILLAPFAMTFLHDGISAVCLWVYNAAKGNVKELCSVCKSTHFKWLALASAVGGPIGMTGYVMAVNYMGASVGAVASAIYPAIGTALACLFLKERVKWYQWIFLVLTLLGVYGLSYSPALQTDNFWPGLLGAFMCALGWGMEAVVLAKCFRDTGIKNGYALTVRQTVSALLYGLVILPVLGGWSSTATLLADTKGSFWMTLAAAALSATASYLLYYRAISRIGAAKAMALNITYTAWAMLFTVILLRDTDVINPVTLICSAVIVTGGILAATDLKELARKHSTRYTGPGIYK